MSDNDLVMHFIVVEDVFYAGRNGVSDHKHVMRKMTPSSSGMPITINPNESKDIEQVIVIDDLWIENNLSIVVFVQSAGSKTVHQSETISYNDLTITGIENEMSTPNKFSLDQNYPNPFNPSTKISWQLPVSGVVIIKVYDVLGKEIATIINEDLPAGKYELEYNASNLPSGIYFYSLSSNDYTESKKMILLK